MKDRFEELVKVQNNIIKNGVASGSSLLIGDRDGVVFESHLGVSDPEKGTPADENTLYNMYSMTKGLTVTAALMLYEEKQLDIYAPVSFYIPEYRDLTVCRGDEKRPARTVMTVSQLFTMTSGLTYLADDPDGSVTRFADEWRGDIAGGKILGTVGLAKKLAGVPLAFDPGAEFCYGLSHDVLGALIEIVSGKTLAGFMRERIFDPLSMDDTYFYQDVPGPKLPRLAANTAFADGRFVSIPLLSRPVPAIGADDPSVYSGGSGLVGTARDYGRFLAAMLNNELLEKETMRLLTSPQLDGAQRKTYNAPGKDGATFGPEHTFGFGVRVQDKESCSGSVGEWGWSGALGTWFFEDVSHGAWFLYLHQHSPACHGEYINGLRDAYYRSAGQ